MQGVKTLFNKNELKRPTRTIASFIGKEWKSFIEADRNRRNTYQQNLQKTNATVTESINYLTSRIHNLEKLLETVERRRKGDATTKSDWRKDGRRTQDIDKRFSNE